MVVICEGSEARLIVISPEGHVHEHALRFPFKALNNEAKYEALLAGMDPYYARGVEHLCTLILN